MYIFPLLAIPRYAHLRHPLGGLNLPPWAGFKITTKEEIALREIRIPNKLITDGSLPFSARRLGAYFCAVSNRLGLVRKSLAMLSGLSGLSVGTVRASIDALESAGYLTHQHTYRYDYHLHHLVYDRTVYQVHKYLPGGFTLIPSDYIFTRTRQRGISSSAFVLGLYLFQQGAYYHNGASRGRAFPTLQMMVDAIAVAKSTVCRALQQLKAACLFFVQNCIRRNHKFTANSYFFINTAKSFEGPAPGFSSLKFYTLIGSKVNALHASRAVSNLTSL